MPESMASTISWMNYWTVTITKTYNIQKRIASFHRSCQHPQFTVVSFACLVLSGAFILLWILRTYSGATGALFPLRWNVGPKASLIMFGKKFKCYDKIPWQFPDSQMAKIPWHSSKLSDMSHMAKFPDNFWPGKNFVFCLFFFLWREAMLKKCYLTKRASSLLFGLIF